MAVPRNAVLARQTSWRNAYIATKRMAMQHLGAKVLVINLGAKAPTTSYNFGNYKKNALIYRLLVHIKKHWLVETTDN
jgi:hypothetical protein